jgi:hypothetical protein
MRKDVYTDEAKAAPVAPPTARNEQIGLREWLRRARAKEVNTDFRFIAGWHAAERALADYFGGHDPCA